VRNYDYSQRNNPEERSSQLLCGGSRVALIISSEELEILLNKTSNGSFYKEIGS
jgi:hypothetical protein